MRARAALRATATLLTATVLLAGCRSKGRAGADAGLDAPLGAPTEEAPEPRPGMVWIPPGVLIAGTPSDRLPRVADEEMAGEQVVMRGFHVDLFPYPNEAGAIPTTSITQAEARELCEAQQKRLCTELELERACKGPANQSYEYGDSYKASVCGTGNKRTLVPNGFNAGCVSSFGVHDLHGGVWSWTASEWKRDPSKSGLVAQRGGNGPAGELHGRCANGRANKPDTRREDVGVRCCAGDPNTFEVVLSVTRGDPLKMAPIDNHIAPRLASLVPAEVQEAARAQGGMFKVHRTWAWHPTGNEELWISGGCARPGGKEEARCGVVVARLRYEGAALLSWVPTDYWQPTIGEADSARELFLYGGDRNGAFRRKVTYAWGRIAVSEKERKKKRKGRDEPEW